MALLPCVFGPHRFRGKSGTVYPAVIDRAENLRWKFRVCKDHGELVETGLKDYEVSDESPLGIEADTRWVCPSCLQLVHDTYKSLYVTTYFVGQERRDYWAKLHDNCGAPAWIPYTDATPALP